MTPERMAAVVARWVQLYTRNVPRPVAERRIDEIDADLHDHVAHERAEGTSDRRIALSIAARMVRGLAADASWRLAQPKEVTKMHRSAARVALVTALILLVPLVANLTTEGPGWSVPDFVFGGVLLAGTGLLLELAARKPRNAAYLIVAAAIGVTAIVLGEGDDAPGLVLFGCLLILGAAGLALRSAQLSRR